MEELNKNNKINQNNEEIEEYIPTEDDFVTDENINYNQKKERKIIKKSKKLEQLMEEEGLTETEVYQKYGQIDGQFSNTTEIEEETTDKLQEFFSDIVNVEYTANMEHDLDEIADAKKDNIKKFSVTRNSRINVEIRY